MITHSSMLNTGTHNWTTAVPKASLVARNKSLTWLSMVLGAILSLNHQLLNVTAYDTSALFAHNLTSNESEPNNQLNVQSKEYVPVFELVLGTITYLVSCNFFIKIYESVLNDVYYVHRNRPILF